MTEDKKGVVRKFRQVNTVLPPNELIIESLEELLDLAKCGSLQQLSYLYATQEGNIDYEHVGWIEGFEETVLGYMRRSEKEYIEKIEAMEEEEE